MPKFAQYDSKAVQPTPVIGFYDTGVIDYSNLPASTELVQMSDSEWDIRLDSPLYVLKGKLVPKPTPTAADLVVQFTANKTAALAAVDQFHANTAQQLAGNPTQVEKDSWAMKLSTANAVIAKATVSAEGVAFMTALGLVAPTGATAAQIATADAAKAIWAAKVQANAAKFAGLVGLADNLRTQAKDAITAAVDQVALDAAQVANKAAALAAIAAFPKV